MRRSVALVAVTSLLACQVPPNLVTGRPFALHATIHDPLAAKMRVQATSADVNHLTLKLYKEAGAVDTLTDTQTATAPYTGVSFNNVTDGTFYITAEAFSSANDSVSITSNGAQTSTNTATVTGGVVSYSAGVAFDVTLQLTSGGTIPISVTAPGGSTIVAQLIDTSDNSIAATYTSNSPSFKFYRVPDGTYKVATYLELSPTTSSFTKLSSMTATVAGETVTYSSGSNLNTTINGNSTVAYTPQPTLNPANFLMEKALGVAVDDNGNVYAGDADRNDGFVFKITPGGQISPLLGINSVLPYGFGNGNPGKHIKVGDIQGMRAVGNYLYVVDDNPYAYRIDLTTGAVSYRAGTGVHGNNGDSGVGTSMQLELPQGVGGDSAGNTYVADMNNQRIVKIDTAGNFTVVAGQSDNGGFGGDGGPATAAFLGNPSDVLVDPDDNLYIADASNNAIRFVPAANGNYYGQVGLVAGNIYTIAGGGGASPGDGGAGTAAALSFPTEMAFQGNTLYFNESTNRIRSLDRTTGIIDSVAFGTGIVSTYSGDGGPAMLAEADYISGLAVEASGDVYIADKLNQRIRVVDSATQDISTYTGQGPNALDPAPYTLPFMIGLVPDGSNGYYLADWRNNLIYQMSAGGALTTLAGQIGHEGHTDGPAAAALIEYPLGLCLDGTDLYFSENGLHYVRKLDLNTNTVSTVAGTGAPNTSGDGGPANLADVNQPLNLVKIGNALYFSELSGPLIRKIDLGTGNISTFAGSIGGFGAPVDGEPAVNTHFIAPYFTATDGTDLFVADAGLNAVYRIDLAAGTIHLVAGTPMSAGYSGDGGLATSAQLNLPFFILPDSIGNLYIGDSVNNVVRRVDPNGIITTVAGSGTWGDTGSTTALNTQFGMPGPMTFDPNGNLLVLDWFNNKIRKFD